MIFDRKYSISFGSNSKINKRQKYFLFILSFLIISLLFFAISPPLVSTNAQATNNLNVLFFLLDDLDENTFNQALNNGLLPNIKNYIVDKGVRFVNSFVVDSQCCPSRATYLTGKYSHNTGVFNVSGYESGAGGGFLRKGHVTNNIATWLDGINFDTALVGKYMGINGELKIQPGWDYWRLVSGYDPRPGMYWVQRQLKNDANPNTVWPDTYQTKYIGDSAINFINGSTNNFYMWVTPMTPHMDTKWTWYKNNLDNIISEISIPLVSSSITRIPNINYEKEYIKGPDSSQLYHIFKKDCTSLDGNGNCYSWSNISEITTSTFFSGTGNEPIAAYNKMIYPDLANNGIRELLVRGDVSIGYTLYKRDTVNGAVENWTSAGSGYFTGSGNLPIAGLAVTSFPDSNGTKTNILQVLLRGTPDDGYDLYIRARVNGVLSAWSKEPDGWDGDSAGIGPYSGVGVYDAGSLMILVTTVYSYAEQKYVEYFHPLRNFYADLWSGNVLGISSDKALSDQKTIEKMSLDYFGGGEEDFQDVSGSIGSTTTTGALLKPPQNMWYSRLYPDGSWPYIKPGQTYDISLYGGVYPAGKLRLNGDFNSAVPVSPIWDIPNINSPNFNTPTACTQKHPWLCRNWPDMNEVVFGGETSLNHARKQQLDALESMISVDVMVGQVMGRLAALGVLDNTLVVFAGDNGYFRGEHRMGSKLAAYEDSIRVPLIIRPPNSTLTQGLINENTILNIDIVPTILDYVGLPWDSASYNVDGRSLKPVIEHAVNQNPSDNMYIPWRKWFMVEFRFPRDMTDPTLPDQSKVIPGIMEHPWYWAWAMPDFSAIRVGKEAQVSEFKNHLYLEWTRDPLYPAYPPFLELYDMNTDQYQISNLMLGQLQIPLSYAPLKNRLDLLKVCAGPVCRQYDGYVEAGDGTGDGHVDLLDFSIWLNNYLQITNLGQTAGDYHPIYASDGIVNGADYAVWLNNFGR